MRNGIAKAVPIRLHHKLWVFRLFKLIYSNVINQIVFLWQLIVSLWRLVELCQKGSFFLSAKFFSVELLSFRQVGVAGEWVGFHAKLPTVEGQVDYRSMLRSACGVEWRWIEGRIPSPNFGRISEFAPVHGRHIGVFERHSFPR